MNPDPSAGGLDGPLDRRRALERTLADYSARGQAGWREALRRYMREQALLSQPPGRAFDPIFERAGLVDPRLREIFDQAVADLLEASLELARLEVAEEKRRLAVFLRRAGLSGAEAAALNQPPVCRPAGTSS